MTRFASTYPAIAKALRILLTFALVFGTTLQLENIAFGAEAPALFSEPATGEGFISEIVVYEVSGSSYSKVVSTNDKDPGAGKASISERQGERYFMAVASWVDADGKALSAGDKPWRSNANGLVDWSASSDLLSVSKEGDFIRVKAAGTADGQVPIEVALKSSVSADRQAQSLKSRNMWVTVGLTNQPEPEPEPDPKPEPKQDPYITSIQILDENGSAIESGLLNLDASQTTYGFQAQVNIIDPEATVEEGQAVTVVCTPEKGLGTALAERGTQFVSGFQFQDTNISWHIEGSDTAQISAQGVLSAPNDGSSFTVHCTTDKGDGAAFVTVTTGEAPKEQPYVTSLQILKSDGSAFADGEELEVVNDEPAEEGAISESATYQFQTRVTYFDPETEFETVYLHTGAGWQIESGEAVEAPFQVTWEPGDLITQTGLLSLRTGETTTVRCFTVDGKDGQGHEDSVVVRNMSSEEPEPLDAKVTIGYTPVAKDQDALLTAQPEGVEGIQPSFIWERSTDQGATWETIDQTDQAISVTTDDEHVGNWYRVAMTVEGLTDPVVSEHVEITVAQEAEPSVSILYTPVAKDETATLVAEPKNVEGLTHQLFWEESTDGETWTVVEGQPTEGAEAQSLAVTTDDDHLGRQYRIRMVVDGVDDPLYSNIVTIRVKNEDIGVVIDYIPVPIGQTASLEAVPRNIGDATPSYSWERSTDGGNEWTPTEDRTVTISVPTDQEHIGQFYRVKMTWGNAGEAGEAEDSENSEESTDFVYSNPVEIRDGTDNGQPEVIIYYEPVAKGEIATLIQHPKTGGPLSWYPYWEESTDGGSTWHELDEDSQQLDVMTDDEHIGRQYRARNDVVEPTKYSMYSNVVTIREGEPKFRVRVKLDYKSTGQKQTLVADVFNIPDGTKDSLTYIWEMSSDQGANWSIVEGERYPSYTVLTDASVLANLYRVRARTPGGAEAISLPQMLAAVEERGQEEEDNHHFTPDPDPSNTGGNPGGNTDSNQNDPGNNENNNPDDGTEINPDNEQNNETIDNENNNEVPDDEVIEDPTATPTPPDDQTVGDQQPTEQQQPQEQPKEPETMTEMVERLGEVDITYDNGDRATMKPLDQLDAEVMNMTPEEATTPGLRLRELYMQEEKPDIHKILVDNPFGRLLIPFVLAMMAAGALEKYLRYREQRRPSLAAF